jgi:hypothetical protein
MSDVSNNYERLRERLTPPAHSDISAVLNGAGNGMMLTGLPSLILRMFNDNPANAHKYDKAVVFATIAGCLLGGVYGVYEAQRTRAYRQNVADEVIRQSIEMDALRSGTKQNWEQRVKVEEKLKEAGIHERT